MLQVRLRVKIAKQTGRLFIFQLRTMTAANEQFQETTDRKKMIYSLCAIE